MDNKITALEIAFQSYLIKALASEPRFWKLIDRVYDEVLPPHHSLARVSKEIIAVNELRPAALLRALKLLTINSLDQQRGMEVNGELFEKIFKKQIAWCEKHQQNMSYIWFMHEFAPEEATLDELRKFTVAYVQIRRALGLDADPEPTINELFHTGAIGEIRASKEAEEQAEGWLKAHNYPTSLSLLTYDESLYTAEFMPFEYITHNENVPMSAYENYKISKADVAALLEAAKVSGRPYDINRYLTTAFIMKSLAKYAEECKSAYIDLALSPEASPTATVKKQMAKLEADARRAEQTTAARQEKLNELQLKFDRLQRDADNTASELAELREYTALLEENLSLAEDFEETPSSAPAAAEFNQAGRKVVVIGGHDNWQVKVKALYPDFVCIGAEEFNFDVNLTRAADIIIFNFAHCSHKQFYRMRQNCDMGKVVYIASPNTEALKRKLGEF